MVLKGLIVNHVCCAHITECGLIAYQRKQTPFTHEMKAYKKLSFDIKGMLYNEFTPYKFK